MAQCPNCSAAVADDFGLIECVSCHAQLLVHIDGTVEYSGAGSDEPSAVAANVVDEADAYARAAAESAEAPDDFEHTNEARANSDHARSIDENEGEGGDAAADYEAPPYEDLPYDDVPYEAASYDDAAADGAGGEHGVSPDDPDAQNNDAGVPDAGPGEPPSSPSPAADAEYDFDAPEPGDAPGGFVASAPLNAGNGSPDLSDVADFGNSDASGGRDGALRYNLLVSGIDTSDVREAFREALTDRKFLWDIDQIVRSIRDGECHIANVSAVKAHVLISRLRQMPVQVEWEQYAIHRA